MSDYIRIEVWFVNGLFRAFPHVVNETRVVDDNKLYFTFGKSGHQATIFLDQINFMEISPDED